ncbi:MAG: autotransporter-associated beta strand repeat-containing protein [Verrucomicrobiota bacterium]
MSNLGGSHVLSVSNTALTSFAEPPSLAGNNQVDADAGRGGHERRPTIWSAIQNGAGTGAGSLVKNGAGNLALNGTAANTFSGGLTVNGGTVTVRAGPLGAGAVTVNAATVNVERMNWSMSTLTMAGGVDQRRQRDHPDFGAGAERRDQCERGRDGIADQERRRDDDTERLEQLQRRNDDQRRCAQREQHAGQRDGERDGDAEQRRAVGRDGSVGGAVVLNGGKIGAGTSGVGSLGTVNETWNPGSSLLVDLQDVASGEGVGWDVVKITGSPAVNGRATRSWWI